MTKKHYTAIAADFRMHLDSKYLSDDARERIEAVAKTLCYTLAEENPRFSRMRFLDACGVKY